MYGVVKVMAQGDDMISKVLRNRAIYVIGFRNLMYTEPLKTIHNLEEKT